MSTSTLIKKAGCHVDLHTVSRCCTRGESEDHTGEKAHKNGSTLALKLMADVTRSPKQGYQWPHEKDLYFPNKIHTKASIRLHLLQGILIQLLGCSQVTRWFPWQQWGKLLIDPRMGHQFGHRDSLCV